MELIQHAFVTFVAFAAAGVICRRVFTTLRPTGGAPRCASCQSGTPQRNCETTPRLIGLTPPTAGEGRRQRAARSE